MTKLMSTPSTKIQCRCCLDTKREEMFGRKRGGNGRRGVCTACATRLETLQRRTKTDDWLCYTCGWYRPETEFEYSNGSLRYDCRSCHTGSGTYTLRPGYPSPISNSERPTKLTPELKKSAAAARFGKNQTAKNALADVMQSVEKAVDNARTKSLVERTVDKFEPALNQLDDKNEAQVKAMASTEAQVKAMASTEALVWAQEPALVHDQSQGGDDRAQAVLWLCDQVRELQVTNKALALELDQEQGRTVFLEDKVQTAGDQVLKAKTELQLLEVKLADAEAAGARLVGDLEAMEALAAESETSAAKRIEELQAKVVELNNRIKELEGRKAPVETMSRAEVDALFSLGYPGSKRAG